MKQDCSGFRYWAILPYCSYLKDEIGEQNGKLHPSITIPRDLSVQNDSLGMGLKFAVSKRLRKRFKTRG